MVQAGQVSLQVARPDTRPLYVGERKSTRVSHRDPPTTRAGHRPGPSMNDSSQCAIGADAQPQGEQHQ